MVDYCQEVSKEFMMPKKPFDKNEWFGKILNYSDFLKQPLMLGMFVPCDLENDPLLPPGSAPIYTHSNKYMIEYQEAKKRVLFEGIEYVEAKHEGSYNIVRICKSLSTINYPKFWGGVTVESLIPHNLTLTPTAKKQIGL